MTSYWYIKHDPAQQPIPSAVSSAIWPIPRELTAKLRPGHRVVAAIWEESEQLGRVKAFGVCRALSGDCEVEVDCVGANVRLKPRPTGMTHWRSKAFFEFAGGVVERYCLDDLFAEHLGVDAGAPRRARADDTGESLGAWRRTAGAGTPGHIYVLKSPYGYKIGKTVNLRDRLRLFAVKLPFANSLECSFRADDYTAAEGALHRHFAQKRLEGEWFNLDEDDLTYIMQLPSLVSQPA